MKNLIILLACLTCSTGALAQGIATAIQTTMRILATQPDGSVSVGSGGGLFNNEGELIGLLAFISSTPGEKRYAIPVEWLDADIEAARNTPFWKGDAAELPAFLRP